jgi:hypothetical protein
MEASEIIGLFRQQVDDAIEPYHLSTADALLFLAEAEEEAAIRAHLIRETGAPRSLFAIAANQSTVKLDARVYWVEDASFQLTAGGRPWGLEAKGMDWVEDQCDWQGRLGRPDVFVHDDRTLRLWPTPSSAGTLTLRVRRTPLFPIEDVGDEPEIPQEHHRDLVYWMQYRTYNTKDSELYDEARAKEALGHFVARFGERNSAKTMRTRRDRRRVTTRPI